MGYENLLLCPLARVFAYIDHVDDLRCIVDKTGIGVDQLGFYDSSLLAVGWADSKEGSLMASPASLARQQ